MEKQPLFKLSFLLLQTQANVTSRHLEKAWEEILTLDAFRRENGIRDHKRRQQAVTWFRAEVEERLLRRFRRTPEVAAIWPALEQSVGEGDTAPQIAAAQALAAFGLTGDET